MLLRTVLMALAFLLLSGSSGRADQLDLSFSGPVASGFAILDVPGAAPGQAFAASAPIAIRSLSFSDGTMSFSLLESGFSGLSSPDGSDVTGTLVAFMTDGDINLQLLTAVLGLDPTADQYFTINGMQTGNTQIIGIADPEDLRANYLHVATTDSGAPTGSQLFHPLARSNQQQPLLFVTHNFNPNGSAGVSNPDAALASWNLTKQRWELLGRAPGGGPGSIAADSVWNVLAIGSGNRGFTHSIAPGNLIGNETEVVHPGLDGDPNAQLLVRTRDEAGSSQIGGIVPVYNALTSRWRLIREDGAAWSIGNTINVYIAEALRAAIIPATAGSSFGYLDDERLNDNPYALFQIQRTNLHSSGLEQPARVGFDTVGGRWFVQLEDGNQPIANDVFDLFIPPAHAAGFESGPDLDQPLLVRDSDELILATHTRVEGDPNNDLGVAFFAESKSQRVPWVFGSADLITTIPADSRFAVWIPQRDALSFGHESDPNRIVANSSPFSNPWSDGDPNAIVFIAQSDVHGLSVEITTSALGVSYDGTRWSVFHQDLSSMLSGERFAVYVSGTQDNAFVHIASIGSIASTPESTQLDHPSLNDHPSVDLIVTQNWNPGGGPGLGNSNPVGTEYDSVSGRWSIRNRNGAALPVGAAFNVLVVTPVCGDVDHDGELRDADSWKLRNVLAGSDDLDEAGQRRCSVSGGASDCDIGDWAVMRRSTFAQSPGTSQVCSAAN
ncbi:MAG: hypothetical protein GY725_17235 [bacterium]|nr:hypothetical protein [bacterium]